MWVTVLTIVVPAVVVLVAAYFTYQNRDWGRNRFVGFVSWSF